MKPMKSPKAPAVSPLNAKRPIATSKAVRTTTKPEGPARKGKRISPTSRF